MNIIIYRPLVFGFKNNRYGHLTFISLVWCYLWPKANIRSGLTIYEIKTEHDLPFPIISNHVIFSLTYDVYMYMITEYTVCVEWTQNLLQSLYLLSYSSCLPSLSYNFLLPVYLLTGICLNNHRATKEVSLF